MQYPAFEAIRSRWFSILAAIVLGQAATTLPVGAADSRAPLRVAQAGDPAAPGATSGDQPQPPSTGAAVSLRSDFRATLTQYGTFVQHPRYGEVWIPTSVPQGWHPYPPCHWVNTRRDGWYFDDRTPWGAIVHHYGRWAHDERAGWIWVPDDHFSPGWVVWRAGMQWVGWAPMPPDADIHVISADAFDNGGFWIFMESARFTSGCLDGVVAPAGQTAELIRQTRYITQISYVDGIAVVQLPSTIVGTFVDINVTFDPWPTWFFVSVVNNFNWVWSNLTIIVDVVDNCPPR